MRTEPKEDTMHYRHERDPIMGYHINVFEWDDDYTVLASKFVHPDTVDIIIEDESLAGDGFPSDEEIELVITERLAER